MKLRKILLAAMMFVLCCVPASALEYSFDAPDDYLFGRPTSDDTIYELENPNVDRSKNTALIAPGFGTPTSYLPNSGEYLTPNLVPGALSGGLVNSVGSAGANTTGGVAGSSTITGEYPSVDTSGNFTMTQIKILRIAHRRQHTAQIGGYGLKHNDTDQVLLAVCHSQNDNRKRDKGEKRYIIGDQHGAEEAEAHQYHPDEAGVFGADAECVGQRNKHTCLSQPRYHRHQSIQQSECTKINVFDIFDIGRDQKAADHRCQYGNDQHRLAPDKRTNTEHIDHLNS